MLLATGGNDYTEYIQWYYTDNNKKTCGPIDIFELYQLFQTNIITKDTFVWNPKIVRIWAPLRSITKLYELLKKENLNQQSLMKYLNENLSDMALMYSSMRSMRSLAAKDNINNNTSTSISPNTDTNNINNIDDEKNIKTISRHDQLLNNNDSNKSAAIKANQIYHSANSIHYTPNRTRKSSRHTHSRTITLKSHSKTKSRSRKVHGHVHEDSPIDLDEEYAYYQKNRKHKGTVNSTQTEPYKVSGGIHNNLNHGSRQNHHKSSYLSDDYEYKEYHKGIERDFSPEPTMPIPSEIDTTLQPQNNIHNDEPSKLPSKTVITANSSQYSHKSYTNFTTHSSKSIHRPPIPNGSGSRASNSYHHATNGMPRPHSTRTSYKYSQGHGSPFHVGRNGNKKRMSSSRKTDISSLLQTGNIQIITEEENKAINNLHARYMKTSKIIQSYEYGLDIIENECNKYQQDITIKFDDMIENLEKRKKYLLDTIQNIKQNKSELLNVQIDKFKAHKQDILNAKKQYDNNMKQITNNNSSKQEIERRKAKNLKLCTNVLSNKLYAKKENLKMNTIPFMNVIMNGDIETQMEFINNMCYIDDISFGRYDNNADIFVDQQLVQIQPTTINILFNINIFMYISLHHILNFYSSCF